MAKEICECLNQQFQIAVRVRKVRERIGFRAYQIQKPQNRHLVDVRSVEQLPLSQRVQEVLVLAPAELVASKIASWQSRQGKPKAGSAWRDLAELLLTFPDLKSEEGPVADCLRAGGTSDAVLEAWKDVVAQEIVPDDDDAGY